MDMVGNNLLPLTRKSWEVNSCHRPVNLEKINLNLGNFSRLDYSSTLPGTAKFIVLRFLLFKTTENRQKVFRYNNETYT